METLCQVFIWSPTHKFFFLKKNIHLDQTFLLFLHPFVYSHCYYYFVILGHTNLEEETPAQAEARANASMILEMERISRFWAWLREISVSKRHHKE